jgi:murein DD-endopeptidase MepM/ murein hydrolase activator NlpD
MTLFGFFMVFVTGVAAIGYVGFGAYHGRPLPIRYGNYDAAELQTLRFNKASLEAQLEVFADRMTDLDKQIAQLKSQRLDVAAITADMSGDLALPQETPLVELLPHLSAAVSWADSNRAGEGGSEPLSGALSLSAVGGNTRDTILGLNRDLDRLLMETDDTRRYLLSLKEDLSTLRSVLATTPVVLPMDRRVSASFGQRTSPFGGTGLELHRGLDIPAPMGTLVRAPADGTVLSAGPLGGYGLMLTVDHGHGLITRYAHLSETLLEAGDPVMRGQAIARTGNSGRSTGPHLHYETILGGVAVDPLILLPPAVAKNVTFKENAEHFD